MGFGQIDPARLNGDALTKWYLRSPAAVEEEKRQAASRAYEAFFSQLENPQAEVGPEPASIPASALDGPGDANAIWRQIGPNRYRSERASEQISSVDTRGVQLAAADFPACGRWPINGCFNCHDTRTGDLLPGSAPTPRPPTFSPRYGGGGGGGSTPQPRRDEPTQCEIQERSDRGICGQQPTEPAKAVCNASATERRRHCDVTGEIGEPDLYTARRKSGRRWP